MSNATVEFHDNHPHVENIRQDVVTGLSQSPRMIPPKYFYDEKGSQLFDLITRTKEYYPTRTENSIIQKYKGEIVESLPQSCVLIEPGGGDCSKVLQFIEELHPNMYVPIDISKQYLHASAQTLALTLPWLEIHAICDDFTNKFSLPDSISTSSRVVFFPGSSIGNFHPNEVVHYLEHIALLLGEKGYLVIGVDLKKDKSTLEQAYDDSEGVTAQFNLNLLARINNELSANFDLQAWSHYACYNSDEGRIEMHLKSQCEQVVNIHDYEFYFAEGETIHTENSYKYTLDEFSSLVNKANFTAKNVWVDENNFFSVHLFQVNPI